MCWIINVAEGQIEVHADRTGPVGEASIRERSVIGPDGDLALMIDGREVDRVLASDLLPGAMVTNRSCRSPRLLGL